MKRLLSVLNLASLILLICLLPANASLVQWTQNGTITDFSPSYWDSSVTFGTPFTASIIFDDAATDTDPSVSIGYYESAAVSASMTFGNYSFTFTDTLYSPIEIFDNYSHLGGQVVDGYSWLWATYDTQNTLVNYAQGFLLSSNLSLINGDALNIQSFDVSEFDLQRNRRFEELDSSGNTQYVNGEVSSYSVAIVPEPSTLVLAILGLTFVAIGCFRPFLRRWSKIGLFLSSRRSTAL